MKRPTWKRVTEQTLAIATQVLAGVILYYVLHFLA